MQTSDPEKCQKSVTCFVVVQRKRLRFACYASISVFNLMMFGMPSAPKFNR